VSAICLARTVGGGVPQGGTRNTETTKFQLQFFNHQLFQCNLNVMSTFITTMISILLLGLRLNWQKTDDYRRVWSRYSMTLYRYSDIGPINDLWRQRTLLTSRLTFWPFYVTFTVFHVTIIITVCHFYSASIGNGDVIVIVSGAVDIYM